jgi:hypothetical protein
MVLLLNHNKNAKCFAFNRKQILTSPCFQIKCNYRTAKRLAKIARYDYIPLVILILIL